MFIKWILSHQIKETVRSSFWQKQIAINILIGLMVLVMMAYLVMLGIFIDQLFEKIAPDTDPIYIFNGIVLYYFGIEFMIRFVMQSLPVLNIETYLMLPVKKSAIVHYVASKSIFSVGNFLSWLIFIPFAMKVIAPRYSTGATAIWILGMILLVFCNNFLATYTKRQLAHKPWITALIAAGLGTLLVLDNFHVFSLTETSRWLMDGLLNNPVTICIPLLALASAYLLNYFFLRERLYPDEINVRKQERAETLGEMRYLKSKGLTGHLILLDLRLMTRNKRTKTTLYMSPIFILYGLFLYPDANREAFSSMLVFIGIFMTGGIMISYLNYCFSNESSFFDGILANYDDFRQYIRAKYLLAMGMSAICYVLTVPYVFYGYKILLINTATFLYNIGFLSLVMLYLSTFSTKRVDLSRSASFNYQGMGASQWLAMLPGFLLPVLIFWPFKYFKIPYVGYLAIGLIGIAGLVFNKALLNLVTRQFMNRRHEMAKGFRE